jgi:hypothetical protein
MNGRARATRSALPASIALRISSPFLNPPTEMTGILVIDLALAAYSRLYIGVKGFSLFSK